MSSDSNSSKLITIWKTKLFECIIKLTALKVPCHAVLYEKGSIENFGTPDMMNKFNNNEICDCSESSTESWCASLKKELFKLVESDEQLFDQDKIDDVGISNYVASLKKLKKLPAPLSVCLFNEIISYLSYLIIFEHMEKGHQGAKIECGTTGSLIFG